MAPHPFDLVAEFGRLPLLDQLSWLMEQGRLLRKGVSSMVYQLGDLLVVLDVDDEWVRGIQVYPAPGVQ